MIYNKKTIEFYNEININKANLWQDFNQSMIEVKSGSHASGEYVIFQFKLDKNKKIIDNRFQVFGCGYMIALVQWFSEFSENKSMDELKEKIDLAMLQSMFQLPDVKNHCALTLLSLIEQLESQLCEN